MVGSTEKEAKPRQKSVSFFTPASGNLIKQLGASLEYTAGQDEIAAVIVRHAADHDATAARARMNKLSIADIDACVADTAA